MQVIITAVGPDNRGLADPIIHDVSGVGANIHEIQMYDHDSEKLFAMLLRMEWPGDAGSISELRSRLQQIGLEKNWPFECGLAKNTTDHRKSPSAQLTGPNRQRLSCKVFLEKLCVQTPY